MVRPARHDAVGTALDPDAPAVLYLELRADEFDAARLEANVAAFCDAHDNAVQREPRNPPRHLPAGTVVAYIAISGGTVRAALRGEAEARRATSTLVAAMNELHMFDPVVVPPPDQNPADDRPRGAP
jgi:hypothetical protein